MADENIQKTYPRDVFMRLLNTIALYVSVSAFLNLVFDYIDFIFPDKLNLYYNPGDSIRWTLSLFIVIFAVFLWTSRFIEKDLTAHPEKRELKIRRWLVYLTVFLAALLLIGDIVALFYNFMNGDLTTPFVLKILSVLILGGIVFWYYLYDLRKNPGEFSSAAKIVVWCSIAVAVAAVVYGFYIAGSPFKQRMTRFDDQRVSDLQTIQNQIVYYWQQKDNVPQSLNDLVDSISGFTPPLDPETNQPYEYSATSNLSFRLCANFALSSDEEKMSQGYTPPYGSRDNWEHAAGRVCFDRSIDTQLYKPNTNKPAVPAAQ